MSTAPALAQSFARQQQVLGPQYSFGGSVDVDGEWAVVGMRDGFGPFQNGSFGPGRVWLYRRSGQSWALAQEISLGVNNDGFGARVAIKGQRMVASALSPRRVLVFEWNGSSWIQQATLTPSDNTAHPFGSRVDLDGDYVVVGAGYTGAGSNIVPHAYVYERTPNGWVERQLAPDAPVYNFGSAVSVSGNTVCIGADEAGQPGAGSVYMFIRTNAWSLQQRIAPAAGTQARHGLTCVVQGDTVAFAGAGRANSGLYVFARTGTTWTQQLGGVSPNSELALHGDVMMAANYVTRSVTVYRRAASTWSAVQTLAGTRGTSVQFGEVLAFDGTTLAVGDPSVGLNLNGAVEMMVASANQGGPPSAPTNFVASVAGNAVNMSWAAPTTGGTPTSYTLIARTTSGAAITTIPLGLVTSFSAAAPNGVYVLSVTATNAVGTGPESAAQTVTVPAVASPPNPPINLVATVSGQTVTFNWAASATGGAPSAYTLLAGATPGFTSPLATVPLPATPTSASFPGVPAGVYYARMLASNSGGTSPASAEIAFTVAGAAPPGVPTLNPPQVSGSTVNVSWSPASTGGPPTSYVLTAATTPGGAPIATVPLTGTSASFPGVPGGTYYLRLTAVNAAGTSAPSAAVTVTVL